jgi:hypothetical protein
MLTAGQAKYAAFKKKVASDLSPITSWVARKPYTTAALLGGASGAVGLVRHGPWGSGGMSPVEEKRLPALQAAEQLDQSDPSNRAALKGSLSGMQSAASNAEIAGAGLANAGALYGGLRLSRLVNNNLKKTELGQFVPPEHVNAMEAAAGQIMRDKYKVTGDLPDVIQLPHGGVSVGRTVPQGGIWKMWPKFIRKREEKGTERFLHNYLSQVTDPEYVSPEALDTSAKHQAESALRNGLIAAPLDSGPHIAAHEFGHGIFQKSNLGKVTQALRLPGALLGIGAGNATAAMTDPDSTASKLSPLISAAGVAPIIGEEAAASIHALKLMKSMGYPPEALSTARRQLGKAFGTYALGLGAPVVAAPYIVRKIKQWNQARRAKAGLPSSGELRNRVEALEE